MMVKDYLRQQTKFKRTLVNNISTPDVKFLFVNTFNRVYTE